MKVGIVVKNEQELEDAIFQEISDEEEDQAYQDSALLDEDEDEEEFVQGSVDIEDLAAGFSATIPTREIDVDEDTQGDELVQVGGEKLLTEIEMIGDAIEVVHGDEIQLDLDDALTTGRTVTKAPEGKLRFP
jgi:hypothetical protein